MNDRRIAALVRKEWRDVARNGIILATLVATPLILVATAVGMDVWMASAATSEKAVKGLPESLQQLPPDVAMQVVINESMSLPMLLVLPMFMPIMMATYTIVGEKEEKSLEPLLATPVGTAELILAKAVAYAAPVVIVTWVSYALLSVVLYFVQAPLVFAFLVRPTWTLGFMFLTAPLSMLSALLGLMVSSRAKDPKAAQAIGMVLVPILLVPMLMGFFKLLTPSVVTYAAAVLLAIDVVMLRVAVPVFSREHVLMRWK